MCRSIKKLRDFDEPPTDIEIDEAARQFVRKVSGYTKPSKANEAAFNEAISEIAGATRRMLDSLQPAHGARREVGAAQAS